MEKDKKRRKKETWSARRVDWRFPADGFGMRDEGTEAFFKLFTSNIPNSVLLLSSVYPLEFDNLVAANPTEIATIHKRDAQNSIYKNRYLFYFEMMGDLNSLII